MLWKQEFIKWIKGMFNYLFSFISFNMFKNTSVIEEAFDVYKLGN
jgi:hypothetical protein